MIGSSLHVHTSSTHRYRWSCCHDHSIANIYHRNAFRPTGAEQKQKGLEARPKRQVGRRGTKTAPVAQEANSKQYFPETALPACHHADVIGE